MTVLPIHYFPLADVGFAFRESNLAGQLIVLILLVGSVFAWTIMVSKVRELNRAGRLTDLFMHQYRKESHPLNLFLRQKRFAGSPVYEIYEKACLGVAAENDRLSRAGSLFAAEEAASLRLTTTQIEGIRNLAERNVADQALLLENNMGYLATAVSTAPFLGLLGTVWGVMDSFGGMARTGAPTLAAVAPGISGALLTTVVGLLVALPSAIGYNWITNRIRTLCVQMDNFAQEFSADIQRNFGAE
ncbi:MAG TPA: MotA/TolQ/ExbB proton channel family protein [Kiritimatiellia bacterium]|nr:MotA/TolQ/ExbB proton channel family protein [Kiritimatiellia bacterium]HNS79989.1 MotA/TolQ/ExbB proton channel family protein [Kiritimatiellia bacterium]HQQ03363.1 MotA/TolQ/ExbB proton channel family protein [Kiritimatiellia bacterium]